MYKKAWDSDRVFQFIKDAKGTAFDPELVDLFVENFNEFLSICRKYTDEWPKAETAMARDPVQ